MEEERKVTIAGEEVSVFVSQDMFEGSPLESFNAYTKGTVVINKVPIVASYGINATADDAVKYLVAAIEDAVETNSTTQHDFAHAFVEGDYDR